MAESDAGDPENEAEGEGTATAEEETLEVPTELEDSTLCLIVFYPYEGKTFLSFAFLGPEGTMGMHLEDKDGERIGANLSVVGRVKRLADRNVPEPARNLVIG